MTGGKTNGAADASSTESTAGSEALGPELHPISTDPLYMRDRVFVIAEAGVNHDGSAETAKLLIDAAASAGADAVKFQTFVADRLTTTTAPKAKYQTAFTAEMESQHEMLRKLELSCSAHRSLTEHCAERGILFMSSPFDVDSIRFLSDDLNLPILKIPSGELTNPLLLLAAARTGKPLIVSTGMATLNEVEAGLGVLAFGYTQPQKEPSGSAFKEAFTSDAGQMALQKNIVLLHCTTQYPAPVASVNLRAMATMSDAFGLRVGYSDHTNGTSVAIAAAALGAVVIEKHFTLDRNMLGPDHAASLEPDELKQMVSAIRDVELALGSPRKVPASAELENLEIARRSLVASQAIESGSKFGTENLCLKRPGTGVSGMRYFEYLGKRANRNYEKDELID